MHHILTSATRDGSWLSAGPIRPGIRSRYNAGVFFVGNIAGEAHPIVAEGISMAMQSAWVLAQVLQMHQNKILSGESADAGRDYTQQWNRHFANRIHAATLFAQLAMRPWAVGLILPFLKRFPVLLTFGAKLSGKINQVVPTITFAKSTAIEKENTT